MRCRSSSNWIIAFGGVLTLSVFLCAGSAQATTRYVPTPYPTIQAAIDAAPAASDEVVVADGTYTGTGNQNLDFHGKAITVRSASGDPAACIIDCESSGRGFYFHSSETTGAAVDGFTIRYGYVTDASPGDADGGGVTRISSSPTLTKCMIIGDTAAAGGAVRIDGCCMLDMKQNLAERCVGEGARPWQARSGWKDRDFVPLQTGRGS